MDELPRHGAASALGGVGYSWQFNSQGYLVPVSFADGDAYLIGLKEDGVGEYLTTYGRARAGVIRALCKFLADDPELCDRLAQRKSTHTTSLKYAVCIHRKVMMTATE